METRLTSLLGIRHPIVCAPMGPWSERELAIAVSNGGGLGTFGAAGRKLGLTERHVRDTIAAIRDRTDAPFGAGFITQLIAEHPANLDVVLEAGVPVVLFSFADPSPYLPLVHQTDAVAICQVQSFEAAQRAVDGGAHALCVQGNEAGGHTGTHNLLPFLCQVLDAFPGVPVLASGGITTGRALAAVLAAGAEGAWMGTAFLVAEEAAAVEAELRDAILASDGRDTTYGTAFDIMYEAIAGLSWPDGVALRSRRYPFAETWQGRDAELRERLPELIGDYVARLRERDPAVTALLYGEGAGALQAVRPAAEIIERIVEDASDRLRRLGSSSVAQPST